MKLNKSIFIALLAFPLSFFAQEKSDKAPEKKLERAAFESSTLVNGQTNVLYTKGTLQLTMNHRFGMFNNGPGQNDFFGLWAPANIRLALDYAVTDRIAVGFGTTKDSRLQDLSLKVALLRQTKDNSMPVSVTYYGNVVGDARPSENFIYPSDRYSFFNQLIIARRFSSNVSFQIAPSWSHYNYVERPVRNDVCGLEIGGRVKINPSTSILLDYSQTVTNYGKDEPKPGVSLGVEFSTGSHAFQLFVTNYRGIVPQQDIVYNQNDFMKGKFVIGFNITRLWHM
jgi:hypothetical protein